MTDITERRDATLDRTDSDPGADLPVDPETGAPADPAEARLADADAREDSYDRPDGGAEAADAPDATDALDATDDPAARRAALDVEPGTAPADEGLAAYDADRALNEREADERDRALDDRDRDADEPVADRYDESFDRGDRPGQASSAVETAVIEDVRAARDEPRAGTDEGRAETDEARAEAGPAHSFAAAPEAREAAWDTDETVAAGPHRDEAIAAEPAAAEAIAAEPAAAERDAPAGDLRPDAVPAAPVGRLWPDEHAQRFRERWRDIQLRFVDDPHAVAGEAADLVGEVVDGLRSALDDATNDLHRWRSEEDGDTERLRMAVRRYRDFVDRLLGM
jgi:hypothetical protein